jgi:hypothetical protein
MDLLHWWYIHAAYVVSFPTAALAFLTNMNEKHKCTPPSAIQVQNQWEAISTEEKIDLISRLEKGEQIVDIWHNVIPTHNVRTIRDNIDTVTESAKSGTRVFV